MLLCSNEDHPKDNNALFLCSLIGIYGKRSSSPSLTQFDFFHPFHGHNPSHPLMRRSLAQNRTSQVYFSHATDDEMTLLFHEFLATGLWYLTIINDGLTKDHFRFTLEQLDEKHERLCLNNCNNRGICQQGVCLCQPSYAGADCSIGKDQKTDERSEEFHHLF